MSLHSINTSNGNFEYHLVRSSRRRRTMEIRIRHEGCVEVHAPHSFSQQAVEAFLTRKDTWILDKLAMFRQRQALLHERSTSDVKECFYLGRSLPVQLQVKDLRWGRIVFDEGGWAIEIPQQVVEEKRAAYAGQFLEKWFKSHALIVLRQRVDHYTQLMGDRPQAIRIRSPRSLWGSCHPVKRVIHFNWRILMAPLEVIDYLVVHEMSHLRVADHSARFWRRVETFCPAYKTSQDWLKVNGYQLRLPFGY